MSVFCGSVCHGSVVSSTLTNRTKSFHQNTLKIEGIILTTKIQNDYLRENL